jgi:diacylglycerol kinase (ATP)
MDRVRFIINPSSGRQSTKSKIDNLCKFLLDDGYTVGKYYTKKQYDAVNETIETCSSGNWDIIIACGGDGTVNEVATGIVRSSNKLPVAILASGTINDFAKHINMPSKMTEFFKMIKKKQVIEIDLGKINDGYFVNVAGGGLLTDVGSQVSVEAKTILGPTAYYLEVAKKLISQEIEPIHMSFQSEEYTKEEDVLLFFISNSPSIAGFKKMAPDANISDGLLDVLIIKDSDVAELANIFFSVSSGVHINHPNVVYFKTKELFVGADKNMKIDIDGEVGKNLPAHFEVIPKAMKIIVNQSNSLRDRTQKV